MLSAEELARVTARLIPDVSTILRESRAANTNPRGDGLDPRTDVKQMFGSASRRPVLLTRLSLEEGALAQSEFNVIVDVAMIGL